MFDEIDWCRPWLAPFLPVLREALDPDAANRLEASEAREVVSRGLPECAAAGHGDIPAPVVDELPGGRRIQAPGERRLEGPGGDWPALFNAAASRGGIRNHRGMPLQFAEQAELPAGTAYEAFIDATGRVPTRHNLHDFFNALVWLAYPQAKAQLNAAQAAELYRRQASAVLPEATGKRSARGVIRDRATIFDENAAILVSAAPAVEHALQAHSWHDALMLHGPAFDSRCELRLFGHALIEKLVRPYKAITAHVWVLRVGLDYFDLPLAHRRMLVDRLLCAQLRDGLLEIVPMALPVLGVPGWWSGQDAAFYADTSVFRPRRTT